jgi:hypothetical protein
MKDSQSQSLIKVENAQRKLSTLPNFEVLHFLHRRPISVSHFFYLKLTLPDENHGQFLDFNKHTLNAHSPSSAHPEAEPGRNCGNWKMPVFQGDEKCGRLGLAMGREGNCLT